MNTTRNFPVPRILILAILALTFILPSNAQEPSKTAVGVSCNTGHYWNAPCQGDADCDRVWRKHLCDYHNDCGNGTSSGTTYSNGSSGGWTSSHIGNFFMGGLTGAIVGSFDGGPSTEVGAVVGSGVFTGLSVLFNAKDYSTLSNTLAGAVAGGLLGAGIGLIEKAKHAGDTQKPPDNTVKYAAWGVAAGTATGFAVRALSTNESFINMPFVKFLSHAELIVSDRGLRFGMRMRW